MIAALPDIVTVLAIVLVIRLLTRLVAKIFDAVEQERLTPAGCLSGHRGVRPGGLW